MTKLAYDEEFYARYQDESRSSATKIVPLVLELTTPRSVVDVGCGVGAWLAVFRDHGIQDMLGLDGDYVNPAMLQIDRANFRVADLRQPLAVGRTFDLVVSLEVAEHLPEGCARTFVQSLTSLGPVVLFSAAIPFQGGAEHINEQWPEYWVSLFREHAYQVVDVLRWRIWSDSDIAWYYRQNVLLFVKMDAIARPSLDNWASSTRLTQLSIVHPDLYTMHHTSTSIREPLRKAVHALFVRGRESLSGVRRRFAGSKSVLVPLPRTAVAPNRHGPRPT